MDFLPFKWDYTKGRSRTAFPKILQLDIVAVIDSLSRPVWAKRGC